ncbi:MAG: hypothetical protein ACWA6X_08100 [Bauldia sp.]
MTTFGRQDVACGVCGAPSVQTVITSTNRMGYADLDLRAPPMERGTIHAWLQECPSCGFVSTDIASASDAEKAAARSGTAPPAAVRPDDGIGLMRRFQRRAAIDDACGDLRAAGFRSLNAAWVADDQLLAAAADRRREAAGYYERHLATDPPAEEAHHIALMLVDILRRSEAWDAAAAHCDRLAGQATAPIIQSIVRFQSRAIAARDSAAHTLNEIEAANG